MVGRCLGDHCYGLRNGCRSGIVGVRLCWCVHAIYIMPCKELKLALFSCRGSQQTIHLDSRKLAPQFPINPFAMVSCTHTLDELLSEISTTLGPLE